MESANLPAAADILWAAIAAGGLERIGAYGTESAILATKSLLSRIAAFRTKKGQAADPASRNELLDTLLAMASDDASLRSAVQQFNASRITANTFNGPVDAREANFGFSDK
ncbi:hypothetical protein [Nonomuraea sp. SBT364]|uniref:hypothetical protein n=1 Tax=Nonomuraea sp. SBT364 TaxID=1580530 RepID=UPI000AF9055E|nr:hypothetical protein [Nonomuraea sp. SBT364]